MLAAGFEQPLQEPPQTGRAVWDQRDGHTDREQEALGQTHAQPLRNAEEHHTHDDRDHPHDLTRTASGPGGRRVLRVIAAVPVSRVCEPMATTTARASPRLTNVPANTPAPGWGAPERSPRSESTRRLRARRRAPG
jgi:hypothetical protein